MGIEGGSSNNEIQNQEINQSINEQIEQNQAEHQRSGEELEGNSTIDNEGERKQIEGKDDATEPSERDSLQLDEDDSIENDTGQEQPAERESVSPEQPLDNQDTIDGVASLTDEMSENNQEITDTLDLEDSIEDEDSFETKSLEESEASTKGLDQDNFIEDNDLNAENDAEKDADKGNESLESDNTDNVISEDTKHDSENTEEAVADREEAVADREKTVEDTEELKEERKTADESKEDVEVTEEPEEEGESGEKPEEEDEAVEESEKEKETLETTEEPEEEDEAVEESEKEKETLETTKEPKEEGEFGEKLEEEGEAVEESVENSKNGEEDASNSEPEKKVNETGKYCDIIDDREACAKELSENLKNTLTNFEQEKWDSFSPEEKLEKLNELKDEISKDLGIEYTPRIETYSSNNPNDFGYYERSKNVIHINTENLFDGLETADTVAHEMRHCYQYEHAENPTSEIDFKYKENLEHYISPAINYEKYESQLIERDAADYASSITNNIEEKIATNESGEHTMEAHNESFADENPMKGAVFDEQNISKFKIFGEDGIISQIKDKLSGIGINEDGFKTFSNMEKANEWAHNSYSEWTNSLTSKDICAIEDYTGDGHYQNMNKVLRGIEDTYEGRNEQIVSDLSDALNKAEVPENITLYRGTVMDSLGELATLDPQEMVGKVIEDKGFFSASFDESVAEQFQKGLVLEIEVPEGTSGAYVADISPYGSESELLLNKGQNMIIKDYDATNLEFLKLKVEII